MFLFTKLLSKNLAKITTFENNIHIKTGVQSWEHFFGEINEPWETITRQRSRLLLSDTTYVFRSLFREITLSGQIRGGAIFIDSENKYLLVEKTTIMNCKTDDTGGGICCLNVKDCALFHVCGYQCSTDGMCMFGFLKVADDVSNSIFVNDSTISCCTTTKNEQIISLDMGRNFVKGLNSSKNMGTMTTGLGCWPNEKNNIMSCKVSYSLINDNIATQSSIIFLGGKSPSTPGNHIIEKCNIIKNKVSNTYTDMGILFLRRKTTVESCCFHENEGLYLIYHYEESKTNECGESTLINCFLQDGYKTYKSPVIKNPPKTPFTNSILFVAEETGCINLFTPKPMDKIGTNFEDISAYLSIFLIFTDK